MLLYPRLNLHKYSVLSVALLVDLHKTHEVLLLHVLATIYYRRLCQS